MNVYNVIILDESGSMSSAYNETLSGINEVLAGIRKNQAEFPDQHHYVTLVTFEGTGISGVKTRRDRAPIESIALFAEKDYRPGGCTPLYDAMGKTLSEMEGLVREDDRVMVTIITDGMENASTEYSGKTIKAYVERLRRKGWVFAYIGANQDAVEVARDLHIGNALKYQSTPAGTAVLFCKLSASTRKMAERVHSGEDLCDFESLFDDAALNES